MVTLHSENSLAGRLGIKEGSRIIILNPPANYRSKLERLPRGVSTMKDLGQSLDLIQFFVTEREALDRNFPILKRSLSKSGMLWISWPKRSSGIKADLDEDVIRQIGLKNGLVDIKICAIDDVWSGLKFVYRLKDRR